MKLKKDLKIVIVEDDLYYNKALTKYVETICDEHIYPNFHFIIKSYFTAHDFIEEMEDDTDIIILDYLLINDDDDEIINGDEVINVALKYCPDCKIIMVSGESSPHTTAEMLKKGVYEFIDKNVNSRNRIGSVLQSLLKHEFQD
jgi:response regulator of citrate/malate metabolism